MSLICKYLCDHLSGTIQLARINNFQFLILTRTGLILMIFIGPENHQFRASSFRGLARNFFGRVVNIGYHGWGRKFGILDYSKCENLVFSQYIPHTLCCLFQSLFFIHVTVRIFRICQSLKASCTYTFSHKIKLT